MDLIELAERIERQLLLRPDTVTFDPPPARPPRPEDPFRIYAEVIEPVGDGYRIRLRSCP